MKIAIRLHVEWSNVLIPFFNSLDRVAVYEHSADEQVSRTHIHALVETSVSTDTLKNRIEQHIGFRPSRSDWAFSTQVGKPKAPVEDKFITYMSKGKLDPVFIKGFTQDECDRYKALWIEKSQSSDPSKKQVVSGFHLSRDLASWIEEQTGTDQWIFYDGRFICNNPNGRQLTEHEIIEQCIKIHNKYEKSYCDFSLARCIQTAYGLTTKGSWKLRLVESVKNKLALKL